MSNNKSIISYNIDDTSFKFHLAANITFSLTKSRNISFLFVSNLKKNTVRGISLCKHENKVSE